MVIKELTSTQWFRMFLHQEKQQEKTTEREREKNGSQTRFLR